MAANWRVTEVQLLDEYAIRVRFTDGVDGVVRFLPEFFSGVFSHLIDPAKFGEVAVVGGAVTWPGELDLAPDAMYDEIKLRGEWEVGNEAKHDVEHKPGTWAGQPVPSDGTESFLAAIAGTLSEDFPTEITDDDLGVDVPRHDWG
jgi:hypothetical protein